MRILILGFSMGWLLGFLLGYPTTAEAGDFYQYTDSDGVVTFTDNESRIPAAFKSEAVERTFSELRQTTAATLTPHNTSGPVHIPTAVAPVSRNRLRGCTGHVTVTSVRQQVGDYNRRFIVVTDECGRTVSVTPSYPHVQINR